jgi:hypothetical protein
MFFSNYFIFHDASGFDTAVDQECENVICTHPGENATCVQEGIAAVTTNATTTTPAKLTCEECLTKFLNAEQILLVTRGNTREQFCAALSTAAPTLEDFESILTRVAEITGEPRDSVSGRYYVLHDPEKFTDKYIRAWKNFGIDIKDISTL